MSIIRADEGRIIKFTCSTCGTLNEDCQTPCTKCKNSVYIIRKLEALRASDYSISVVGATLAERKELEAHIILLGYKMFPRSVLTDSQIPEVWTHLWYSSTTKQFALNIHCGDGIDISIKEFVNSLKI